MIDTEMRLDPLRHTWTVFSKSRVLKPEFAKGEGDRAVASGLAASPFVAGRERFAPHSLHTTSDGGEWQTRVVPSRTPVLRVEGEASIGANGFYDRMDGVGAHEVIIETPAEEALEELPLPAIRGVITAWKSRMLDLTRDDRMRAFFIIKNTGEQAGATLKHSISQLIAMAVVPFSLRQKLIVTREFYGRKKRSIFEDILREEVRTALRLVYENNGFAAFCPYASRTPFEQAIYPKRQCADFHGITDQEIAQLADMLKMTLLRMMKALDRPAYNLVLFTAPTRTPRRDHWNTLSQDFRWHIEIVPRLFYPNGFEVATGCHLNSVLPEAAAECLRKVEV